MSITELSADAPAIAASSISRSVFAAHGILCPCPGCKGAINASNAGSGAITSAANAPDGDTIHNDVSCKPTAADLRLGFLKIGFSGSEVTALAHADRIRYGISGAAIVEAMQLSKLAEFAVARTALRILSADQSQRVESRTADANLQLRNDLEQTGG